MAKPAIGSTVNPAHALAPSNCFVMNEGTGRPQDIGLAALPAGTGDTPTWSTESSDAVTVWDGTKHVDFGTGPLLVGNTKFTVVVSVKPANITHTAAWIAKRNSGADRPSFACGMVHDSGFGDFIFFSIGDGVASPSGTEPFQYGWYGWSGLPSTQQQLIFGYDGSRAANDRVRLWREGVQITAGLNGANLPARYEDSNRAVVASTSPIWLGQGAAGAEANGEYNGTMKYLYVIPNFFPSSGDITAL